MADVNVVLEGDGNYETEVVGESHYQDNLENICGPRSWQGEDLETTANLVFEDSNPYDRQAVRVDIAGRTVGYLTREQAPIVRQFILSQLPAGGRLVSIQCPAKIVGGWDRGDDDQGHYGVRLDIRTRPPAPKPLPSKIALTADSRNAALADRLAALTGLLKNSLPNDPRLDLDALRRNYRPEGAAIPAQLRLPILPPNRDDFVGDIKRPGKLAGLFQRSWRDYEIKLADADRRYAVKVDELARLETTRQAELARLQAEHESHQSELAAEIERHNQQLAAFAANYSAGDPAAICRYHHLVIERSPYPADFSVSYALAYQENGRRLVITADMPGPAIVPATATYKYVRSRDELEERPRKASEIKQIYQDVVAAVALRTIHEAFRTDQGGYLSGVIFDGTIDAVDAGTGQRGRLSVVWLQVTPEKLGQVNLAQVDPSTCVKELGGRVIAKLPINGGGQTEE